MTDTQRITLDEVVLHFASWKTLALTSTDATRWSAWSSSP